MFRKRPNIYIAILIICAILLSVLTVYASSSVAEELKVSARSAALYQPDTGRFIFTKNHKRRMHMASTTKIMTALLALEQTDDLSLKVEIDKSAEGVEGSSAYLKAGELVTMRELIYALLLQSANDAAVAIAVEISGGIDEFAELMNDRAKEIGLEDTHFTNPHGLDDEQHYTTAHDLAIIAAEAMKNEDFCSVASTYKKTITDGERRRTYINHNKLLKRYEGAIGVKTGFTDESGRCLVGAAERDGLKFISVTLDAPNDWADHERMLDFGFSQMKRTVLAMPYEYSYKLPVSDNFGTKIQVTNTDELAIYLDFGEHTIKRYVNLPRFISHSVKKGDCVGYINYAVDGALVGRVKLICCEDCTLPDNRSFIRKLLDKIFG